MCYKPTRLGHRDVWFYSISHSVVGSEHLKRSMIQFIEFAVHVFDKHETMLHKATILNCSIHKSSSGPHKANKMYHHLRGRTPMWMLSWQHEPHVMQWLHYTFSIHAILWFTVHEHVRRVCVCVVWVPSVISLTLIIRLSAILSFDINDANDLDYYDCAIVRAYSKFVRFVIRHKQHNIGEYPRNEAYKVPRNWL